MVNFRNTFSKVLDAITPDNQVEYLKFTKISEDFFKEYIQAGPLPNLNNIPEQKFSSVKLKVNPQSIKFDQQKIVTKIQTNSPGRFTVFDWGNDLLSITITGCTGNLLPTEITSGFNSAKGMFDATSMIDSTIANEAASQSTQVWGELAPIIQNNMIGTMSYYELLDMSPKYKTFIKLQRLYRNADADRDILILETGETVYRGYFYSFSFEQSAESPWNWVYNIVFLVITNLGEFISRSDSSFNTWCTINGTENV